MSSLTLLTGAYARRGDRPRRFLSQPLTTDRIRYLTELWRRLESLQRDQPDLLGLMVEDLVPSFLRDAPLADEQRTRGAFGVFIHETADSLILTSREEGAVSSQPRILLRVMRGSMVWESFLDGGVQSHEVFPSTLAKAYCLVAPEAERAEAFIRLIGAYPEQAAEWLTLGQMVTDDGSARLPLPELSPENLLPLLESELEDVRQAAIIALGRAKPMSKPHRGR